MFCPQCSQQQVSGEVRFCPRCGFPLDGVAQLLASGGVPPTQPAGGDEQLDPPSPRLKGLRQGVLLWLLGILLVPLLIVLTEELRVLPEAFSIFAAVMFFMGGFVRMVYALLLEDGPLRRKKRPALSARPVAGPQQFADAWAQRGRSALPPQQGIPAGVYAPPRADTSEILQQPPTVTENTTRLLDEQSERR